MVLKYGYLHEKEHKLQVFDNKVFRKTLGPKRDEVCKQFRILTNVAIDSYKTKIMPKEEEIMRSLLICTSSIIVRVLKSRRNAYKTLVVKPLRKRRSHGN
jgi:hypothetical protein